MNQHLPPDTSHITLSPPFRTPILSPSRIDFDDSSHQRDEYLHYRVANQLPDQIRQQVDILLDTRLYVDALSLLENTLTAGTRFHNKNPAFIPTPSQIRTLTTLLVHPIHTTKTCGKAQREIASRSLSILQQIRTNLGPVNADLCGVFAFRTRQFARGRGSGRWSNDPEVGDENESNSDTSQDTIKSPVAPSGLWASAKDFWHIVGWAFNCSVRYPKRWRYWKLLLEYLLQVLDDDWKARERLDLELTEGKLGKEFSSVHRLGSLLVKWLADSRDSSTSRKRVVHSIFSDGSESSLKEFTEVFEKETVKRSRAGQKRKRSDKRSVKLKALSDMNDDDMMELTASDPSEIEQDGESEEVPGLECPDAIYLRQKVMALVSFSVSSLEWRRIALSYGLKLSRISFQLPQSFTNLNELYSLWYKELKPLPTGLFVAVLSPSANALPDAALISCVQIFASRMISDDAVQLRRELVESSHEDDSLTMDILERCYLPWCASSMTAEDNAKLSVLVETLFRLIVSADVEIRYTTDIDQAVAKGIREREKTAAKDKKRGKAKDLNVIQMKMSGRRLRSLLASVRQREEGWE